MEEDRGFRFCDHEAQALISQAENLVASDFYARLEIEEFIESPESENSILEAFVIGEVEALNGGAEGVWVLHPLGEVYSSLGVGMSDIQSLTIGTDGGMVPQEDDIVMIFRNRETGERDIQVFRIEVTGF